MKVCFISLGCDKNTVDSEKVFKAFVKRASCDIVLSEKEADVVILNTCSFIRDAKNESIDYIKYLVSLKKKHIIKKILVIGCLVAENNITRVYDDLFKDVDVALSIDEYLDDLNMINDRMTDVLSFSSFLKVCDGCDKFCSYCIIPYLRGRLKSGKKKDLVYEAKKLVKNGVKELNIVGQDILSYGKDLNGDFDDSNEKPIVTLLKEISEINGLEWIRLLYCYPEEIDDSIIRMIRDNDKVLPYIDMPIQHASNKILKLMNRNTTKERIVEIINKIKASIPDICIRTTMLVGFPGETESDFNELVDFVKEIKFDKLGVFTYSREKLSKSYNLPNQIDEKTKEKRKKIILDMQKEIVLGKNKEKLGMVYNSIVEGKIAKDTYIVRPYFNARNIDDKVYAKSKELLISGTFVNVEITKVKGYDLEGIII